MKYFERMDGVEIRRSPTREEISAHILIRIDEHPDYMHAAIRNAVSRGNFHIDTNGTVTIDLDAPLRTALAEGGAPCHD